MSINKLEVINKQYRINWKNIWSHRCSVHESYAILLWQYSQSILYLKNYTHLKNDEENGRYEANVRRCPQLVAPIRCFGVAGANLRRKWKTHTSRNVFLHTISYRIIHIPTVGHELKYLSMIWKWGIDTCKHVNSAPQWIGERCWYFICSTIMIICGIGKKYIRFCTLVG